MRDHSDSSPPAFDPDFVALRQSICKNLRALQHGLPVVSMFRQGGWDEGLFWDRLGEEIRKGAFNGFLRRWDGNLQPDLWALCRPHFESGRFDHLIRVWAQTTS